MTTPTNLRMRGIFLSFIFIFAGYGICFSVNKTFTGPGDFSDAAKWSGGTLPVAGDRLIIMGVCTMDAAMSELAYGDLQVGKGLPENMAGTVFWPVGSTKTLNVNNISAAAGPGGTVNMTNGGTWKIRGAWNNNAISFIPGTGTVDIEVSPPPFNLPSDVPVYNDLIISPGAGINAVMETNIIVKNLTINSGANLDTRSGASTYNITITGNWSNNGGFVENTSTVTFSGSGAQSITATGGETFYSLTINKPAGDVTLNDDVTVNNLLALTSGDIVLGSDNLTIGTSGTTSGGIVSSYVQADGSGVMKKLYSAVGSFDFPLGDADEYTPFTININSATFGAAPFLSLNLSDAVHPEIDVAGDHITRYWTVNAGDISVINYNVSYNYIETDVAGTEANLLAARWNGSGWTYYDAVNPATNTLSSSVGIPIVPANHVFTGGDLIALPVELLSFKAKANNRLVVLDWATATENNNRYFSIERSEDGTNFIPIGQVEGAGNSSAARNYLYTDVNPLPGISYYRLKQNSFNGRSSYSGVASLNNDVYQVDFTVYPNPAVSGQTFTVNYSNPSGEGEEILITVFDYTGRTLYSKVFVQENEGVLTAVDAAHKLAPGIYFVTGSSNNEIFRQRLVVVDEGGAASFAKQ